MDSASFDLEMPKNRIKYEKTLLCIDFFVCPKHNLQNKPTYARIYVKMACIVDHYFASLCKVNHLSQIVERMMKNPSKME